MTQAPPRPPTFLQPHLKAPSTSKSSALSVPASTIPNVSRASSEVRKPHTAQNAPQVDVTSNRATAAFVRRVLCTNAAHGSSDPRSTPKLIEQLLPPLTSSNEVDLQLYAIIAVIIKEFVYAWYAKITPDHHFVDEVVQIIAHCTRALEERLRRVDLETLVLDELAGLVVAHIIAFKTAHESLHHPPTFGSAPQEVYHVLNPHPALSPVPNPSKPETVIEQDDNESIYRQLLVQGALAVLLPTEDLENVCLRTLVGDIIADLILGNGVSGKACEGWLIWEGITKLVEAMKAQVDPKTSGEEIEVDTRSRLEKFGLLSSKEDDEHDHSPKGHQSQISAFIWRMLQYAYLAFVTVRFVVLGLARASALPSRSHSAPKPTPTSPMARIAAAPASSLPWRAAPTKRPVLEFGSFALASQLLDLSGRMPWLAGAISLGRHWLIHGPGGVGETDGILDKWLSHLIHTHILTPTHLPTLLKEARIALFPNNLPSPPRDPPTPAPAEQAAIRRTCAQQILSLVPPGVARVYLGRISRPSARGPGAAPFPSHGASGNGADERSGDYDEGAFAYGGSEEKEKKSLIEEKVTGKGEAVTGMGALGVIDKGAEKGNEEKEFHTAEIEAVLDVFGDSYMNKHLVFAIVECLLGALVPEMQGRGSGELLGERLG